MRLIGSYTNGNYKVFMYDDGTKVRLNDENEFVPEFPESIDMKISNKCNMGCPYCHEKSIPDGKLANLEHPILNSLRPHTELALGGGNVLEHPGLLAFLDRMKEKQIICNMTVHLKHFVDYYEILKYYAAEGLVHGIGISINNDISEKEIEMIKSIPNTVAHVIAGVVPFDTLKKMAHHNIKLLVLGYKTYGRGEQYAKEHTYINNAIECLRLCMPQLREWFPLISFDNLAIKQLRLREMVSDKDWERMYMGDDGQFTMYVDLVEETFARSSTSAREPIGAETDIRNLFNRV